MRIALVDPSRTVLKIVSGLLAVQGHDVILFSDGHAALNAIESDSSIDTVITSAELVSMSGLELCWQTRLLSSRTRPIYILVMSSSYDRSKLGETLDCGADDFIGKPPIREELYARLRVADRVVRLHRELMKLAATDPLTEALNRRSFFDRAIELCSQGSADPLSAVMFDLDHFKNINDNHGHSVGDEVLRGVANCVINEGVIFGRLGGEEFGVLLVSCGLIAAKQNVEQIRLKISNKIFPTTNGSLRVTASFGVTQRQGDDTIESLFGRADTALYKAKHHGRNCVMAL